MIETLTGFPDNVAAFACHGHVTKADYETVLMPDVEKKLQQHEKVSTYYEIGPDFEGFDAGAMWDDTKVGLGHFSRWERMAVVTDIDWIKHSMKFFGFLMPAELRAFSTTDGDEARAWVAKASTA
jgi:hypothetical protein